jgi:hypothetical protein
VVMLKAALEEAVRATGVELKLTETEIWLGGFDQPKTT